MPRFYNAHDALINMHGWHKSSRSGRCWTHPMWIGLASKKDDELRYAQAGGTPDIEDAVKCDKIIANMIQKGNIHGSILKNVYVLGGGHVARRDHALLRAMKRVSSSVSIDTLHDDYQAALHHFWLVYKHTK